MEMKMYNTGKLGLNKCLITSLHKRMYKFLIQIKDKEDLSFLDIRDIEIKCFKTIKKIFKSIDNEDQMYLQIIPRIYDNDIEYIIDMLITENIENILFVKFRKIIPKINNNIPKYKETISIEENKILKDKEFMQIYEQLKKLNK